MSEDKHKIKAFCSTFVHSCNLVFPNAFPKSEIFPQSKIYIPIHC